MNLSESLNSAGTTHRAIPCEYVEKADFIGQYLDMRPGCAFLRVMCLLDKEAAGAHDAAPCINNTDVPRHLKI